MVIHMGRYIFLTLIYSFALRSAAGQPPDYPAGPRTVTLSAKTLLLSQDLPFDNPFILLLNDLDKVPGAHTAKLWFGIGGNPNNLKALDTKYEMYGGAFYMVFDNEEFFNKVDGKKESNKGRFLSPNTVYTFKVVVSDSGNQPVLTIIRSSYTRTKFGDYVKPDFGFAYSDKIKSVFGFTSAHIYFAPINDDADLAKMSGFARKLSRRTSLFFGISPLTITSDTRQPINKMVGAGNFIYGVGLRSPFYGWSRNGGTRVRGFLQPMRLVVGNIVFRQNDENPLIAADHVKHTFYIGLSYDLNIAELFRPIAKIYTP